MVMQLIALFVVSGVLALAPAALAESVAVKYFGLVNLAPYACAEITRSSFIERVCYDRRKSHMVISLNDTYYAYCDIPSGMVAGLLAADSMGRFYNAEVKGRFGCR
jgi:hypothetical protein